MMMMKGRRGRGSGLMSMGGGLWRVEGGEGAALTGVDHLGDEATRRELGRSSLDLCTIPYPIISIPFLTVT